MDSWFYLTLKINIYMALDCNEEYGPCLTPVPQSNVC